MAGIAELQLRQSAEFYEYVKQLPVAAGGTISFTGHSLGGGLAALMGVFFDKTAVTFDQAPFREAATIKNAIALQTYLLARGYGIDINLAAFYSVEIPTPGPNPIVAIRGESKVSTIAVAREFLTETILGARRSTTLSVSVPQCQP